MSELVGFFSPSLSFAVSSSISDFCPGYNRSVANMQGLNYLPQSQNCSHENDFYAEKVSLPCPNTLRRRPNFVSRLVSRFCWHFFRQRRSSRLSIFCPNLGLKEKPHFSRRDISGKDNQMSNMTSLSLAVWAAKRPPYPRMKEAFSVENFRLIRRTGTKAGRK